MTSKRWVYVGIVAVSGIAFIADRVFLGEPETAAAGQDSRSRGNDGPVRKKAATNNAGPAQTQPQAAPDPTLAWLDRLPATQTRRDVFALSGAFLARQQELQKAAEEADAHQQPGADSVETFVARHELQTTLISPQANLAMVNGKMLHVGDEIDGFQLNRIESDKAHFTRTTTGARVTLALKRPVRGP